MKWQIGYYEGGPYQDYQKSLIAGVRGLMALGWIEKKQIPEQSGSRTRDLWHWMADHLQSDYIRFVKDAHYSAGWDKTLREEMTAGIIARLNQESDIDLMFSLGTWAGQDLASDRHSTPVICMSVSDPVRAGIIDSIEDSGLDHVHARVDPHLYEYQVQVFHDIIHFDRLGLAYENTETGKTYAALDQVERVAEKLGFDIVSCFTIDESPDRNAADESVIKCYQELSKKVDAIYVTAQNGVNPDIIPELVRIVNSHGVPTFSQSGSEGVKAGFLISIAKNSFEPLGLFFAETISKILNGAKPRDIGQVFENERKIAINLKAAEMIGYTPHPEVMFFSDKEYYEIPSMLPGLGQICSGESVVKGIRRGYFSEKTEKSPDKARTAP